MPFTQGQLDAIEELINGPEGDPANSLNGKLGTIVRTRDQLIGLTDEMHAGFADNAELMAVVATARLRAKTAAEELIVLLS